MLALSDFYVLILRNALSTQPVADSKCGQADGDIAGGREFVRAGGSRLREGSSIRGFPPPERSGGRLVSR